ncbi:MAG TPA: glycosyl transferase family 36, partial [Calditrichia bacterium]|nr:glycosyl transferase family 36 [Calditrichia bacterium]
MKSSNTPAFENPFGHFARDGYEFVITTPETPRPWSNIISNGDFGLAVSQAGGGFSWRTHVSMNRLTRWNQDMIRDDWGKWLYLRDLDSGAFRSLAYQPVQAEYDLYEARHGLGYTTFVQKFGDMESEWTLFAAMGDPVEIWLVTLRNNGTQRRRFQLASYLEWNLGAAPDNHREFHKLFIDTAFDAKRSALVATKLLWEVPTERGHWNTDWPYIAFHAASEPLSGWDTSKDQLIGRHGGFHNPRGLREGEFAGQTGRYEDAVASLATDIELAPGEEKTVVFLLGQPDKISRENLVGQAASLIDVYRNVERAREALQEVTDYWKNLCSLVHLETPDPAFNLLNNVWLKYQAISGHLWGRTGYYQQSGAFGFRDQMQASQVWLPLDPPKMLEQARLNARHQFEDGKVLHWWHPLTETGLPTDMVDDLLWLPYMLTRYFNETRNFGALREEIPYYDQGAGSLQEHCVRAIEVVLERFSERGIPLMGAGDWCDGFSAVGLDWKGESVWLGMFLYDILVKWADILTTDSPEADVKTAARFRERARNLKDALNEHAWNGEWYICATKDDGALMGDPSLEENKIYLNSQTWAIITGVADDNRRNKVAQAVLDHLEGDNGTTLFRPAYHTPDKNIGYITRYAPGLRENGGVYTHAATWSVMAFAEMGRGEDAFRLFQKLNPILQAQKDAHRYYAEPFVLPGNIDGFDSPNYGRAGWTWYTGSAGWLFTIAHENIVGVRSSKDGLIVDPCIPREWPSFTA